MSYIEPFVPADPDDVEVDSEAVSQDLDDEADARDAAWRAELRRYARETARATRAAQGFMRESQQVIELDADPS